MNTDLSKFKLTFDLDDIVHQFDCVANVAYPNKEDENQLLVPQFTRVKCDYVDCKVYDKATMKTDNLAMPYSTADLGQPVGYFPPEDIVSVVPIKHWDAYSVEGTIDTHKFEIDDKRKSNGQVFIDIKPISQDEALGDDDIDHSLSVTMEVSADPINGIDHVPCINVQFDDRRMAFSLYKIGNHIALISENDVEISVETNFSKGYGEQVTWFK